MKRIASLAALVREFRSVDPARLKLLRDAWRASPDALMALCEEHTPRTFAWVRSCFNPPTRGSVRRRMCDELLDMHGVELLGIHYRTGAHVEYCNAGDHYNATLIFHGSNAYIGCTATLVEGRQIREARE